MVLAGVTGMGAAKGAGATIAQTRKQEMRAAASGAALHPPRLPRHLPVVVLGHRGAPAHRPEHTLASYAKAIADGADFVEPDLVTTKDGVLVARHENNIAEITDVASHPQFAARKVTKTIDGAKVTGWFTEDFTFAELKSLRARERLGLLRGESQSYDGQFQIVSFEEIADFVAAEGAARGRIVGLIPEIKHSTYFAALGFDMEALVIERVLARQQLRRAPVLVQSFEVATLKLLRRAMVGGKLAGQDNIQLMQLIGEPGELPADVAANGGHQNYAAMLTPAGLAEIATYADYVAPNSRALIPLLADGSLGAPTSLIADAHAAGLLVGTWTLRPENHFLPPKLRDGAGDGARNPQGSIAEMRRYIAAGIDAFFTDDPALGRMAVDQKPAA